jgi:hypothetical protein
MSDKTPDPELQAVAIVALGNFNPKIYQPLWFSSNNLIRKEEAENAKVEIIHNDVAIFSIEWFSLQVTNDRFMLRTTDPTKHQPIRDLMRGTFKILEHTPITAVGFNNEAHYQMASIEEWNAFVDYYAPKESWRGVMSEPGLRSLIIDGKRENCRANQIRVKIEPSRKVNTGVFIHVNEHYDVEKEMSQSDRISFLLETLDSSWDDFLHYHSTVASHLFEESGKK